MKSCFNIIIIVGVVACGAGSLMAQPGTVVTLASVAERVRVQNPNLRAARFTIDEAVGRLRQSGRLENPELETEIEHNTRFSEGRIEIGLRQEFPVTDRLRLEKQLGATEVQAAQAAGSLRLEPRHPP